MNKSKLIYEFQKNALEKVKIQLYEFHGKRVINIRVYYKVPGTANEWKPSKKGICMAVNRLEELFKGLKMAHDRLQKGYNAKKKEESEDPDGIEPF